MGIQKNKLVPQSQRSGITLVELLIVIVMLVVVTSMVLTETQADVPQRLEATANILRSDLEYVRELAVSNASSYQLTFSLTNYSFEHTGGNAVLDTLPESPFFAANGAGTTQTVDLTSMSLGLNVEIVLVSTQGTVPSNAKTLEFGPYGETVDRTSITRIWLACGGGDQRRYLAISVNPVTGLATVGTVKKSLGGMGAKGVEGGEGEEVVEGGKDK